MQSAAVVLAGGASRRMGQDKLTLAWNGQGGKTILDHVLETAASVTTEIAVVVSPARPDVGPFAPGQVMIRDKALYRGPLAALAHAWPRLEWDGCEAVHVLAGDLPGLHPEVLRACAQVLADAGADVDGVAVVRDGRLQPLLACYRPRIGELFMHQVTVGETRILAALAAATLVKLDGGRAGWPRWWTQPVHTPAEYDAWRREVAAWQS